MNKISVGQCIAEIFCRDDLKSSELSEATRNWNMIPILDRKEIISGLKEYLISCVGKDMVEQ